MDLNQTFEVELISHLDIIYTSICYAQSANHQLNHLFRIKLQKNNTTTLINALIQIKMKDLLGSDHLNIFASPFRSNRSPFDQNQFHDHEENYYIHL